MPQLCCMFLFNILPNYVIYICSVSLMLEIFFSVIFATFTDISDHAILYLQPNHCGLQVPVGKSCSGYLTWTLMHQESLLSIVPLQTLECIETEKRMKRQISIHLHLYRFSTNFRITTVVRHPEIHGPPLGLTLYQSSQLSKVILTNIHYRGLNSDLWVHYQMI